MTTTPYDFQLLCTPEENSTTDLRINNTQIEYTNFLTHFSVEAHSKRIFAEIEIHLDDEIREAQFEIQPSDLTADFSFLPFLKQTLEESDISNIDEINYTDDALLGQEVLQFAEVLATMQKVTDSAVFAQIIGCSDKQDTLLKLAKISAITDEILQQTFASGDTPKKHSTRR